MGQRDPGPASHLQDSPAGEDAQQADHQPNFQVTMQGVAPLEWRELRAISGCRILVAKTCSEVHPDHGSLWIEGSGQASCPVAEWEGQDGG